MSLRSQALSGFRWTASARLLSQVITWAITLVVIRLLSPSDYGLIAMATAFIAILTIFSEFGLGVALVQKADLDDDTLRQAFGIILLINVSLTALLVLSAPLIAAFYDEPRVVPVICVLAFRFSIGAFDVIPNVLLQRRMEFRSRSLMDLSGAVIASITTLAMAFGGAGVWALVAGSVVDQIWKAVVINCLAPFLRWPKFSLKGMRSLLTFGGRLTAAGVFATFFAQSDIIICAKMLGHEILGIYAVAVDLALLPNQRVANLVNQVAFPTFSRMQHDVRKVGKNVLLGIRILSFFAFPVLWGVSSITPEIVDVILGPKWTLAVVPLQVLSLIAPLRIVGTFMGVAVQGMGRSDIVLYNTIWAAIVAPPLLFAGTYWEGLFGLSLAWLVVAPVIFVPNIMRNAPVINLSVRQALAAMMPPAAGASMMYCAVIGARHVLVDGPGEAVRMCILVAVGALVYCTVSFGLNRKGTLEALEMVQSIAMSKRVQSTTALLAPRNINNVEHS